MSWQGKQLFPKGGASVSFLTAHRGYCSAVWGGRRLCILHVRGIADDLVGHRALDVQACRAMALGIDRIDHLASVSCSRVKIIISPTHRRRYCWHPAYTFLLALLMTGGFVNARHLGAEQHAKSNAIGTFVPLHKRLNLVDPKQKRPSPNPAGWEAYDGSVYTQERGYGWTTQLSGFYAGSGGEDKAIRLPGGEMTTPRALGRLELATWQGAHQENQPLVFRLDLPNGWYRVRCASVAHGALPVIDQRNFSCRAQDAIFAGLSIWTTMAGSRHRPGRGI